MSHETTNPRTTKSELVVQYRSEDGWYDGSVMPESKDRLDFLTRLVTPESDIYAFKSLPHKPRLLRRITTQELLA